jgi:very-short-patch-repair endonuclease
VIAIALRVITMSEMLTMSKYTARQSTKRRVLLEARAHGMRHALSPAEARLWQAIRAGKLGVQFRRQVVLGDRYIADFCAREARLVVEVDGAQHARTRSADAKRDRFLFRLGYRVSTAV